MKNNTILILQCTAVDGATLYYEEIALYQSKKMSNSFKRNILSRELAALFFYKGNHSKENEPWKRKIEKSPKFD